MDSNEKLIKAAEARGVTLGQDGQWSRIPLSEVTDPVTDEQIRFINESTKRGQNQINARLETQWVDNLWTVVQTLSVEGEGAAWPFMSVFWIRLCRATELLTPFATELLTPSRQ